MILFFVDPEEGYKPPEFGRGLEQSLEAVSSPEPDDAETNNETNASTTPTPEEVKDQSDSSNLDADLLLMDQNLELIYDWKIFVFMSTFVCCDSPSHSHHGGSR